MIKFQTDVAAESQALIPETAQCPGPLASEEVPPLAIPPHTPRRRPRTFVIPDELLAAARQGMPTREVAEVLSARLARPVSVQAVYARLKRLGILRPREPAYATRSGEVVLTPAEYQRLEDYHRRRKAHIRGLLEAAGKGDREALTTLHAEFGLRLPLVEARTSPPFPWRHSN